MGKPKVSVVVSGYNVDQYLKECLESIEKQTFRDFECIIVNDGSTDNTENIATQVVKRDGRFRLISKDHGGVSTARNAGFDLVTGEYVIFLDGDDFFSSRLLGQLYRKATKINADIVVCNFKSYFHSMQKYSEARIDFKPLKHTVFSYRDEGDRIFDVCTLMFWNKLFKVDFLKQSHLRNDEELHRAQDIEFTGRALVAASRVTYLKEVLVYYRTDTPASNVRRLHQHPYDVIKALNKLKKHLDKEGKYSIVKNSYVRIAISHILANLYFTETDPVHKSIYNKAKKLFIDEKLIVSQELLSDQKKAYKEISTLLNDDYESWLRSRIIDLRDDSESKYISYLLGEFQRKFADEEEKNRKLQEENDALLASLSWRVTEPLRRAHLRYGKKGEEKS